ncbi:unnamed protein product [marine sediment metagenome]|uniref:Uncharacterized protein n=1 Tax=marine sediment metagenome TaxID=412755 RepID=X1G6J7_9ZZZZ
MDDSSKGFYLSGIRDGIIYSIKNIINGRACELYFSTTNTEKTFVECLAQEMFLVDYLTKIYENFQDNIDILDDIITDLYEDPANSYIRVNNMVYIALEKIKGEDIGPLLREERSSAFENN